MIEAKRGKLIVKLDIVPDIAGSRLMAVEAANGNIGAKDNPRIMVNMTITDRLLKRIMEAMLMSTIIVENNIIFTS